MQRALQCFVNSRFKRTGNRLALLVAVILVGLQLLFTYAPTMQALFHSEPLDAASWGLILLLGAALFCAVELEKTWLRRTGLHRI